MHHRLLIIALFAVLCGFGCQKEQTASSLEDTTWRLTKIIEGDATQAIPADVEITAAFKTGQLTGNGGCNDYQSAYTATDDQLSITMFFTTLAGCAQLNRAEERYFKILKAAQSWELSRKTLTVQAADASLVFKRQ